MKKILLRNLPSVSSLITNNKLENIKKNIAEYYFLSTLKETVEKNRIYIIESEDKYIGKLTDFTTNKNYENILNKAVESKIAEDDYILFNQAIKEVILDKIIFEIINSLNEKKFLPLQRIINGSGTILHTNLGRSVFSKEIVSKISTVLSSYTNIEYDILNGKRGERQKNLENLICMITGAESALVVNNNAAAVLLCLNEFAQNKETIISRGELVEIGGSFRIPSIMKLSNSILTEVGTTNRTYISDYEEAINKNTGLIIKVHTSNYYIEGYTASSSLDEIALLSKKYNLISMYDAGSGSLVDFSKYNSILEENIYDSLKSGIDIITFSGDKLLGGCQSGIILGKLSIIERLKKNQYYRTVRVDKFITAILEETFRAYLDEKIATSSIPTIKLITEDSSFVLKRAKILSDILKQNNIPHEIISTTSIIGGGSLPDKNIESYGIHFISSISPSSMEKSFRTNNLPIIGKIMNDKFIIDMKTIFEEDILEISNEIIKIYVERGLL